ncbi:MAG: hypothetical protein IKM61_04485 [Eubacteriaceae bacterium]|nr:hypothetical protein [Eubacteriaceae bacterium]
MNTLKFILGMAAGSALGYAAMTLKDKKISFHVTVDNYGDDDDYDFEDCGYDCECGNCYCADECEEIGINIEDDYMQEGIVFDENGDPECEEIIE